MEYAFAIAVAVVAVVIVSLVLAVLSNRAEELKNKPKQKQDKKEKQPIALRKKKPSSKGAPKTQVNFSYDGEDEDEEKNMLEFLRGTDEFKAKEARDERRKKARADKKNPTLAKESAAISNEDDESEEDVEYVLIKRKKVAEKTPVKKGKKKAVVQPDAVVVADDKKKKKGFFKKGVFQELKEAAIGGKEVKEEEGSQRKGKKKGETEETPAAVSVDERKDKAPKAATGLKKVEGEAIVNAEGQAPRRRPPPLGPDGQPLPRREPREPREPRKPREAPPRPLSGGYDAPSLDDMLSAISTYYGAKTPKETFFSKLPRNRLFAILHMLAVRDVIALSRVNHHLNKLCRDEKLWRFFCERDFKMKFSDKSSSKKKFKIIYKEEYLKSKGKPITV